MSITKILFIERRQNMTQMSFFENEIAYPTSYTDVENILEHVHEE